MHFKNSQNGFSLFEILIAISVLSFMMLGVIQFTQTTFDTSERVIREDAESLQIETALSRIEWDFSHIYSPLFFEHAMKKEMMTEDEQAVFDQINQKYISNERFKFPSYNSKPVPSFEVEDKSTLVFFSASNRRKIQNSKQSHFTWVKYSLLPNDLKVDNEIQNSTKEAQTTQMLVRQVYSDDIYSSDAIDWDDVKIQPLHRKITKLNFEFWDPSKFKWVENLRTIKDGYHIIYGLKVNITYLNSDNLEEYTERIFRPLFPEFTPEDMYKFLNEKKADPTSAPSIESPTEVTPESTSEEEGEPEGEENE